MNRSLAAFMLATVWLCCLLKTVKQPKRSSTRLQSLGNWVMPNPIDGSDEVGICIKEGGIAESIAQSNITYKTWRLTRGKLEIVLVRIGGSEEDETNIYDIVKLGPDSLVYKDVEETFEYSRQKPKEDYGGNIKLEDAEDEFFM